MMQRTFELLRCRLGVAASACRPARVVSGVGPWRINAGEHVSCPLHGAEGWRRRLLYIRINRLPTHANMTALLTERHLGPADVAMLSFGPHYQVRILDGLLQDVRLQI